MLSTIIPVPTLFGTILIVTTPTVTPLTLVVARSRDGKVKARSR